LIRCAIVGCGRIAEKHASILTSILNTEMSLVAAVEPNFQKRVAFSKRHNVQVFETLDELLLHHLGNINLIIVCTPSGSHFEVSRRVIESGINVLIEKPISLRVDQANYLIKSASKLGVKLYVVKQNRFNDAVKLAHESYMKGLFGKPYLASIRLFWNRDAGYYSLDEWRGTWKEDGGALINQAIHHIDIMQWFLGDAESVFAFGKNFTNPRDAWDSVCATILFKNGALGSVQISTATQPRDLEASFALLGSDGTFEISGKSLNEIRYWETPRSSDIESKSKYVQSKPSDIYGHGHKELLENVALHLRDNKGNVIEGSEAIKSLKLASGILRSIEKGEAVQFNSFHESTLLGY